MGMIEMRGLGRDLKFKSLHSKAFCGLVSSCISYKILGRMLSFTMYIVQCFFATKIIHKLTACRFNVAVRNLMDTKCGV